MRSQLTLPLTGRRPSTVSAAISFGFVRGFTGPITSSDFSSASKIGRKASGSGAIMENEGSGGDRADLASVLGDARRYAAMVSYCTGLLLQSERKSVEPMAAMTVDNAGRHARCFWDAIRKRLEDISLSLHPDKTRLIEFGRDGARRAQRGL